MVRDEIRKLVNKAVENKGAKLPDFSVEQPREKEHGDYASNVAMITGRDPAKLVKKIKKDIFEKVEIVKPGFINFFLKKEYLQKQINKIEISKIGKAEKINVEFISANPTGPLTIGNARGGPIGDVLGNVLKRVGFEVEKTYYVNDHGNQILLLGHSVLKDKKAEYKGDYIDYLHKKIREKDPYKAGQKAAQIIIREMIKKTTDKMGIKFDEWISENKLHKNKEVDKTLNFLKKKKLIYEKEGAIWFKSSKFGDKRDRVVIKSDGRKTYLTGDLASHKYKFEKRKANKAINIWGADHHGDVLSLQAGIEALGYKGKLDIVLHQFITILEKGKKKRMSKRKGVYVTMDELIDEVGLDVARFFFLQRSAGSHLNFDLSLAKKKSEKNPVYYVQYAYARICSILRKAKSYKLQTINYKLLNHSSELNLIKQLIRFPEIIKDTAKDYQVQRLPNYVLELVTAFHRFYEDCRVISKDKELSSSRLSLVKSTQNVLKDLLNLMGISSPEKM